MKQMTINITVLEGNKTCMQVIDDMTTVGGLMKSLAKEGMLQAPENKVLSLGDGKEPLQGSDRISDSVSDGMETYVMTPIKLG